MTLESDALASLAAFPLIQLAFSLAILLFGLAGAYLALRKSSQPKAGEDVPQWFYVRDLVHEVRNLRQVTEATAERTIEIRDLLKERQDE